ncbi:uncharacterized protein LOC121381448 [Gigantopelta aegis]|uniref:uncharacterized protein LOC121381448 n=1 Tax=Gigantopelta aegis TaxID=1735272 RepID=UPI001B88ABD5|nr:uncharacterized protein LOC121381448 [Gigantopelta aegis]
MEFQNLFCDNEFVELMSSNISLMTPVLPYSDDVTSRYSENYLTPSNTGDRKSCYTDGTVLLSRCNGSESSNYTTQSRSSESVTSSYDGESVTSLFSGESVTSPFSGDSGTSLYSGESATSSFSGESVSSTNVTSCEWIVSPSISEDLLSHSDFNEVFSDCVIPSDESFSDLISYDDVFDPPAISEMDDSFTEHKSGETCSPRSLCQNIARPTPQNSTQQNRLTYTPRNTHNSNSCPAKPRRKRVQSTRQRSAANVRERNRMVYLNTAFGVLKSKLPGLNNKRLSRIETLRTAISYIKCMEDITS